MNNTTLTLSAQSGSVSTMLSSLLILTGCVVAIMNITVLYAALQISLFQRCAHHNLVLGLTFADTCGALGLVSTGVRFLSPKLSTNIPLCITTVVLYEVGMFTSFGQTFMICLNRYLLMSKKDWNSKLFQGKCRYLLYALHWATGILITTVFFESESMHNNRKVCNVYILYGSHFEYFRITYCSSCIGIVTMTVIFYIKTLFAIRRSFNSVFPRDHEQSEVTGQEISTSNMEPSSVISSQSNKTFLRNQEKLMKKTTKIVGIILVALICLTGPMLLINLVDSVSHLIILATACLALLNSMLNPIIYCANISVLRKKVKSMFHL